VDCRKVIAMLTGHGPFKAHLAKMGHVDIAGIMCRHCGQDEDK